MKKNHQRSAIDSDGYRPNVGLVLCNRRAQLLWARRSGHDGWQFPQGGIEPDETVEQAAFRELYEEVGLEPQHVRLIARTRSWLHYDVPRYHLRSRQSRFKGQKQVYFLFQMLAPDSDICLDAIAPPEFDRWRWVDYWTPVERIVSFKRGVYRRALTEFEPLVREIEE